MNPQCCCRFVQHLEVSSLESDDYKLRNLGLLRCMRVVESKMLAVDPIKFRRFSRFRKVLFGCFKEVFANHH